MNLNYNVDLGLLDIEPIKSLKGTQKFATFHVMSMVIHFDRVVGSCKVPKNQLAQSFGVRKDFFSKATALLIQHKWIKEIKAYDRASQSAAVYTLDLGWVSLGIKLGLSKHQARSYRDQEKELKNNSKQKKSDLASSSSLNETTTGFSYPTTSSKPL